MSSDLLVGPVRSPRNDAREQAGSIHDDETASALGFRGGTVAGSVHLEQVPPLLVEVFGPRWFETGSLSLLFRYATTDGEPVLVKVRRPAPGDDVQTDVVVETPDGTLVAEGTAGIGAPAAPSALHARDLRPVDPSTLRILRDVRAGEALEGGEVFLLGDVQRRRLDAGIVTEPLDWYRESPWGGAVATPATVVDLLYRAPVQWLASRIGDAVGMWGAIEIRHLCGPVLLDRRYEVRGEVVAVSDSPKTEVLWYDSTAWRDDVAVASLRIMTRFVKASSPLYAP